MNEGIQGLVDLINKVQWETITSFSLKVEFLLKKAKELKEPLWFIQNRELGQYAILCKAPTEVDASDFILRHVMQTATLEEVVVFTEKYQLFSQKLKHFDVFDDLEEATYHVLINHKNEKLRQLVNELWGEPIRKEGKLIFKPVKAPLKGLGHGLKHSDGLRYGEYLPQYKEPLYFKSLEQLRDGIVVSIEGKRYKVSYPILTRILKNGVVVEADYPKSNASVIFESTEEELTTPDGNKHDYRVQFFGVPLWRQYHRFPFWKDQLASCLFHLLDDHGDNGTTNVLFSVENGEPVRLWHESSCF